MDLEEKLKAKSFIVESGIEEAEMVLLSDALSISKKEIEDLHKEYSELIKKMQFSKTQEIEDAITEYKSKLVEGQSSGEWQSILLINALRLLNDKERNELALSIIERTTPNLIDEAYKKQSLEITGMLDKMIDNFETTPTDKPIIRGIELTLAKLIKMNIEIQFLSSPKETLPSIKQDKLLIALSPILLLPELPEPKEKL